MTLPLPEILLLGSAGWHARALRRAFKAKGAVARRQAFTTLGFATAREGVRLGKRGRLPGAVVCTRRTCPDAGAALRGWLRGVTDRGFLILLEEEREAGLRSAAQLEGFDVHTVATSRGVCLWVVQRSPSPAGQ